MRMTWNVVVFEFLSTFCFGLHERIVEVVGPRHGLKTRATPVMGLLCRCQGHPRGGLPTGIFLLNVQKCLINCLCQRSTVSGFTIEIDSLISLLLVRIDRMIRSVCRIGSCFFRICRFRISSSFCWSET